MEKFIFSIEPKELQELINKAGDKKIIFYSSKVNPNNKKPIVEVYFNLDLEKTFNDCM